MNCYYHPDRKAEALCSICGNKLCNECSVSRKNGSSICSRCIALEAAEDAARGIDDRIAEKEKQLERKVSKKSRKRKILIFLQFGLIIICLIIVAFQVPKVFMSFEEEKPLKHGDYATDSQTDQCIRNLWKISKMLQEGKLPNDDITCPASNKPYVIVKTDSDIIVRSPNPELYGFKDLMVSKLKPVPELVK